jgi:cobalamin-dependent methionine synthase I
VKLCKDCEELDEMCEPCAEAAAEAYWERVQENYWGGGETATARFDAEAIASRVYEGRSSYKQEVYA